MNNIQVIKIFLASSSELKDDRSEFVSFINFKNEYYIKQVIFLKLVQWENFRDYMSKTNSQYEYNNVIANCDIFVSLFYKKAGKYTVDEFMTAYKAFLAGSRPLIYVYFKDLPNFLSRINFLGRMNHGDDTLRDFKNTLRLLKHYARIYEKASDLKCLFGEQLNILFS